MKLWNVELIIDYWIKVEKNKSTILIVWVTSIGQNGPCCLKAFFPHAASASYI
jgi:hypothetical protein